MKKADKVSQTRKRRNRWVKKWFGVRLQGYPAVYTELLFCAINGPQEVQHGCKKKRLFY